MRSVVSIAAGIISTHSITHSARRRIGGAVEWNCCPIIMCGFVRLNMPSWEHALPAHALACFWEEGMTVVAPCVRFVSMYGPTKSLLIHCLPLWTAFQHILRRPDACHSERSPLTASYLQPGFKTSEQDGS
jgi:hypothetical protein